MRRIFQTITFIFMATATQASGSLFPTLDAELKMIADNISAVDHTIASQDISQSNVDKYISNILKAIEKKDREFFAKIKSCEAIGTSGLSCLADSINRMAPAAKAKMKEALKRVVPLIGYGSHTVDLFID